MSSDSFKKYDTGKPCFSIVSQFVRELGDVNLVMEYGASKYGRDNWRQAKGTPDVERYLDACIRHVLALRSGLSHDEESTFGHAEHAITNLLFYKHLTTITGDDNVSE